MKFDKETLIKQRFWILLLVTLPLSLGAIFLLATSVSGDITATRTSILKERKKYDRPPEAKTPFEILKAKFEAEREEEKKTLVHREAYKMQEELFFWPEEVEKEFNFHSGLFAQKITVYRGKAEPPADTGKDDRQLQGTVVDRSGSFLVVEDKNKQLQKVYKTMRVDRNLPVEGDDKNKEVPFGQIFKGDRVKVAFHRGKYFGEALTNEEILRYTIPVEVYLKQIDPIIAQVEPMNEKGEGVVQLKGPQGWFYSKEEVLDGKLPQRFAQMQKFIVCLERGWESVAGDISEEAWLAQEDLWIQKEIYRLIRKANDSVSRFDNADKNDSGDDASKLRSFSNPLFKIDMKVTKVNDKQQLSMTIQNQQARRQKLDFKLRIQFNKDNKDIPPEIVEIGEEPLAPRGSAGADRKIIKTLTSTAAIKGIYSVEQALNWETAAVKRIDAVNIGSLAPDEYAHSHRTFAESQVALTIKKVDPNAIVVDPGARAVTPGRFNKRAGQNKLDTGANEFTKHYLIRNRYYPPLNPLISRRVPVSVVMIVDQEHVDRVFTSFINSKLRFLPTQFLANRYTGTIRPALPDENAKRGGPGFRFATPPPPPSEEMETNVELVIYGIVTLYERYPSPLP